MNRKTKQLTIKDWLPGIIIVMLALIYTVLVKTVNVAQVLIGTDLTGKSMEAQEISIGFSSLNIAVWNQLGCSESWYNITKILAILLVVVAVSFFILALNQWVRKKSIKKINRVYICMGGLYVALGLVYVLFEKMAINMRPVLEDNGVIEASFPSSHTMLACTIMGGAVIAWNRLLANKKSLQWVRYTLTIFAIVIMLVMTIGRLLSGVHWLTDIIGGVIWSAALVSLYWIAIGTPKKPKQKVEKNPAHAKE